MYLRRYGKKADGEEYGYWFLVESVRTARGPCQRVVANIGKLPDFDQEERIGWEEISRIFSGKSRHHDSLFEKTKEPPSWATVDINRVSVERLRNFGDIYTDSAKTDSGRIGREFGKGCSRNCGTGICSMLYF